MENTNCCFMQTVPNSHSWASLKGILVNYEYRPKELTKEYLLIGFKNTCEREYEIKQIGEPVNSEPIFPSIENIINYIEQSDFKMESFIDIIKNTLNNNIDLICKRKMERQDVYKNIDAERKYQDWRWNTNLRKNDISDNEKPVAEWINYIEYHLNKAKKENYQLNKNNTLAEIRKIAALAVRCMEIHGCPERKLKNYCPDSNNLNDNEDLFPNYEIYGNDNQ